MKQNSPKFQLNKWENSSSNSSAIVDSTIRKQLISTVTNKQGSQIPFQMFFLLNTIYHCDHDVVDSHLNVPPVILTEMVGQNIGCLLSSCRFWCHVCVYSTFHILCWTNIMSRVPTIPKYVIHHIWCWTNYPLLYIMSCPIIPWGYKPMFIQNKVIRH